MNRKTKAIIQAAVALGYGQASDYSGGSVVQVLKELAVNAECAQSVSDIKANSIAGVLEFIAANKGSESNEPFDLSITKTNANVTVKRGNKTLSAANDILFTGDVLTITATAAEGYENPAVTVNGTALTGNKYTVAGNTAIAVTATAIPADPVEETPAGGE